MTNLLSFIFIIDDVLFDINKLLYWNMTFIDKT